MSSASIVLLWLFVIDLGIAFGAGLYEHRIVVPRWILSSHEAGSHWNAEAARGDDTGRRFWALVTTLPLTLLTLVSVFAAWRALGAVRGWWLAATFAALGDRRSPLPISYPPWSGSCARRTRPRQRRSPRRGGAPTTSRPPLFF